MSFRPQSQASSVPTPKVGEVANAIASCSALSFFSISMILANKVRNENAENKTEDKVVCSPLFFCSLSL